MSETSSTSIGFSLQRTGTGSQASDFTWSGPANDSPGSPNTGQSFTGGGGGDITPPAAPTTLMATAGEGNIALDWADNGEGDLAGYNVLRGASTGGPYTQLNAGLVALSDYNDTSVANGTTYYYVVRAEDVTGNESGNSNEANATPQDTTPPAAPTALAATAGDGTVALDWDDNGEGDLAGYNVMRSTSTGGPYTQLNGGLVASSNYNDASAANGTTYYYVVRAEDTTGNESGNSNETNATPQDTTPPAAPSALVATGGDGTVALDWGDNGEGDLAGYDVLRATSAGGPYTQQNGALVTVSNYDDGGVANGTTYYYVVRAEDTNGNESGNSGEASATPQAAGGGPVAMWINEFHYDNSGKDKDEFVEVAGTAGTDLSGWQLLGYNYKNGDVYRTVNLSGTIPNQQSGLGTLSFSMKLQNGKRDGIALVDDTGTVVEFLSYEGTMTADSGVASGMTSTDVGVQEGSSTPVGSSLQRTGSGSVAADFTWTGPATDSPGGVNTGQTFTTNIVMLRNE